MTGDVIIGIDAGTSVIKSVAFDAAGAPLAEASVPNIYRNVGRHGVEQDMRLTWQGTATTLRQLGERLPDLGRRVAAIAVTGQGDGTWLIDAAGEPVAPAWLWLDARAAPLVAALRDRDDDARRFALTGTGLAACQQGPQLAWAAAHRPELPDAAATAFHCKDWLFFRLTGVRCTDPSEASLSFGDFRRRQYDDEVLDILGIAALRRLLPEIVDGIGQHRPLSGEAAAATGLRAGTPVVPGYIDIVCSAIGAGLLDGRDDGGCSILGSTGMHMTLATSATAVRLCPERTGYTLALPQDGCYGQTQSNLAGSVNLDWIVDLIGEAARLGGAAADRADLFRRLDDLIAAGTPGSLVYHPYIAEAGERGPFLDASARAGFYGLSSRHGLADIVRAVAEGLCLAARDCYAASGARPSEIVLCGGVARSPAFRQLFAAILGSRVRQVGRAETGAAGAAMIAAVALGHHADLRACTQAWVTPLLSTAETPLPHLCRLYDEVFPLYRGLRTAVQPHWPALAGLAQRGE